jgi:hypothetical protein
MKLSLVCSHVNELITVSSGLLLFLLLWLNTYCYHFYYPTPCWKVCLDKHVVAQLIRKFILLKAFCNALHEVAIDPYSESWIQFTPPRILFKVPFNIILSRAWSPKRYITHLASLFCFFRIESFSSFWNLAVTLRVETCVPVSSVIVGNITRIL